jgi:hypothetical protein
MKTSYSPSAVFEFRRSTRRRRLWQRVVDWLTEPIGFPGKIVDMEPLQKEYNKEGSEDPTLAPEPVAQLDEPRAS